MLYKPNKNASYLNCYMQRIEKIWARVANYAEKRGLRWKLCLPGVKIMRTPNIPRQAWIQVLCHKFSQCVCVNGYIADRIWLNITGRAVERKSELEVEMVRALLFNLKYFVVYFYWGPSNKLYAWLFQKTYTVHLLSSTLSMAG